jgi:hypothetical protein
MSRLPSVLPPRHVGGAALLVVAMFISSSCSQTRLEVSPSPPANASSLTVVGTNTESVEAATEGDQLYITATASAGCEWVPRVTDVSSADKRVNVTLALSGSNPCGADMFRRTYAVDIELDVHGYVVHVQFDR